MRVRVTAESDDKNDDLVKVTHWSVTSLQGALVSMASETKINDVADVVKQKRLLLVLKADLQTKIYAPQTSRT